MAIKLRVPEADRERLGLPEWVEYDPEYLLLTEAQVLQDELDIDPWNLIGEMQGRPVLDGAGNPVEVDGKPKLRRNWQAWRFALWVAAKRSGCQVAYADFDVNVIGLRTGSPEPEAAADDPKDQSTPEPVSGESSGESAA